MHADMRLGILIGMLASVMSVGCAIDHASTMVERGFDTPVGVCGYLYACTVASEEDIMLFCHMYEDILMSKPMGFSSAFTFESIMRRQDN